MREKSPSIRRGAMRVPPSAHQPADLVDLARGMLAAAHIEIAEFLRQPNQQPQLVEVDIHPIEEPPAVLLPCRQNRG